MSRKLLALSIILSVNLGSCTSDPIKPFEVQQRWSKNMRQLGIVPVFPPREDFFVGDVYLTSYDPDSEFLNELYNRPFEDLHETEKQLIAKTNMFSRLTRLDLSDTLWKEYCKSMSGPATSSDYNQILDNPAVASILEKISTQEEKKKAVSDVKAAAEKAKTDMTEAILTATHEQSLAQTELNKATTNFNTVKIKTQTASQEDKDNLKTLKSKLREFEDKVNDANNVVATTTDPEELKKAKLAQTIANQSHDAHQLKINRLDEDIKAIEKLPVDSTLEKEALAAATIKKEKADAKLTDLNYQKSILDPKKDAEINKLTAQITAITEKLTSLNETKQAVVKAGAKFLFSQPNAGKFNIYTGKVINPDDCSLPSAPAPLGGAPAVKPVLKHDTSRVNRLRLVAFPEFSGVSMSSGDMSALIPAEALGLNISKSNVQNVSVKVPAAESYGISLHGLYQSLASKSIEDIIQTSLPYIALEACPEENVDTCLGKRKLVHVRVISEVFYARALDINLFSSNSFGAVVDYAKVPDAKDEEGNEGSSSGVDDEKIDFTGVIKSSAVDDSDNILSKVQNNLNRTQNVPGGTVQILNYSNSSVGVRRVYHRPIAIGFRGINLTFDLCSNRADEGKASTDGEPDVPAVSTNYLLNCKPLLIGMKPASSQIPLRAFEVIKYRVVDDKN